MAEKRDTTIQMRVLPSIKAMAEEKAKAEGRTLSNYIEQLIIRDNEEGR